MAKVTAFLLLLMNDRSQGKVTGLPVYHYMRHDGLLDWSEVATTITVVNGPSKSQRHTLKRLGLSKRRVSLLDSDGASEVIEVLNRRDIRNKADR